MPQHLSAGHSLVNTQILGTEEVLQLRFYSVNMQTFVMISIGNHTVSSSTWN